MLESVLKRLALYLAIFAVVLPLASLAAHAVYTWERGRHPAAAGLLDVKIPYYLHNSKEFDVVFMGDSRTLTNIHPGLLARHIKPLRAFNLGHWAHWLPTQYGAFAAIVPQLPPETIVVWSIGHQNFEALAVQPVYPVGWERIPFLLRAGYAPGELLANQAFFTPPLMLYAQREKAFQKVQAAMDRPLYAAPPSAEAVRQAAEDAALLRPFETAPQVARVKVWPDDSGRIASVEQYTLDGASLRTEINRDFYRRKQEENRAGGPPLAVYSGDDGAMDVFRTILDLCRAHNVRLVVNVFEESPYIYRTKEERAAYRAFMNGPVRDEVQARGYPFITVDFDRFKDDDYFDFNHMNSRGVDRFSAAFGPLLRQTIRKHYPDAL